MPTPEFTMEQGTVVVGYDGSDEARTATFWAAREASSRRRGLVIVNVVGFPPFPESVTLPGRGTAPPVMEIEQVSVRESAEAAVDDIARECRERWPDLAVTTEVTSGRAPEALARVADAAELLVIGSSGLTALPRMLLGSTAAALLHDHHGPVIVVRQAEDSAPVEGGRVVVGVDGSKLSADAIDFAFDFAERHGSELVAVHAWSDLPMDALAPVRT
jgi:nucleotide-binding universal stress UspA family protein